MKTYEVYKPENRERHFIRKANEHEYFFNKDGCLRHVGTVTVTADVSIDEEWELVPQEVTFAEAMKAYVYPKLATIQSCATGKIYSARIDQDCTTINCVTSEAIDGMWIIKE